jgi:hypothetical protein
MKNKKKQYFPHNMLKSLSNDIIKLLADNEGKLFALELFEEIPYELRSSVVESFSSFYRGELVEFFHLLKLEYGRELEEYCNRALDKYAMAGINIKPGPSFKGKFYKAYATCSRHAGRVTIDVAWDVGAKGVHVEGFYLIYASDGIYSFFVIEDMPREEYVKERESLNDMVEITYEEACALIQDSYNFNIRCMTRPALGRFLYQKYLDQLVNLEQAEIKELIQRLSARLTPRQLVNTLFHALRYQDHNYIDSLWMENRYSSSLLQGNFSNITKPGVLLLEGQVSEVSGSQNMVEVRAYAVTVNDGDVWKTEYLFKLVREESYWRIHDTKKINQEQINSTQELNPYICRVKCRVYEIVDMDTLFDVIDKMDNIREVEELPDGIHMRVTCFEDDFNHGVSLLTGVIADLVINGDEFVIMAKTSSTLTEFDEIFAHDPTMPLRYMGEYDVSLITAFGYLAGQYTSFEDILITDDNEFVCDDGLRFVTARYLVKDRDQVLNRLRSIASMEYILNDNIGLFYQMGNNSAEPVFLAEYMLGSNLVTLSTFGERDMGEARSSFEENMYDNLEFDGMEVREEGIFEILTDEVKKQHPALEETLKELYLNKWYYSHLPTLRGMSPWEACQTEEGTRLLWTMFKKLRQKEKLRLAEGEFSRIKFKEYMRKVQLMNEGQ